MTQTSLRNKTCIPCQGGMPPLSNKEITKLLIELDNNWVINDVGHLYKEYKFSNFTNAMAFANQIAELAEKEAHHPSLMVTWGVCTIEIWTHKINGLTESDFILAAKIDVI
ncbi:4a-hydroxytetrahydrobiopterin dehydratase [Wolbachia pipientis]|uniref:4a-hydroxytetrahydrobiopterin dehydratase n=1 Tax=Wolbachia pipientis TaxID=955 RepID=A0A1E7QJV9_WOLPI|nr:4a-hydroxytetrahydrobiopterin dehydratase [Wolbachia pipientis]OEY86743.1 4a-hydroxytetrahydrobiopterin dehydratase [Wolbachia pipientis]